MATTKKKAKNVYCDGIHHQFPISEMLRERGDGTLPPEIWCQCGRMVELTEHDENGRLVSAVYMKAESYRKNREES